MESIHPDSLKIDQLGGTAAVARLFGIAQPSVTKWRRTGIPSARLMYLKLIRPDVFDGPSQDGPQAGHRFNADFSAQVPSSSLMSGVLATSKKAGL